MSIGVRPVSTKMSIQRSFPAEMSGKLGLCSVLSLVLLGCSAKSSKNPSVSSERVGKPSTAAIDPTKLVNPKPDAEKNPQLSSNRGAMLSVRGSNYAAVSDLTHRGAEPLELALRLPEGDTWRDAKIGRAVVRQPDGSQVSLASEKEMDALRRSAQGEALVLSPLQPGTSMIIVSAGSGDGQGGQDAMAGNHRFSKIIVRQADANGVVPKIQAGVMQKTGQPLEIRPTTLPMALKIGDEMAIKVYEAQSHRADAWVEVHHPSGELELINTAVNGTGHFIVKGAGMHHLVFNTTFEERPASAELTFSVPASGSRGDAQ